MKNILIVILVIALAILAYMQFKPKVTVTPSGQTTTINNPNGPDYQSTNTVAGDSSKIWKTYSNAQFGFSFDYPATWKLTEDIVKKEVTIDTNDALTNEGGSFSYPSWLITFKATDKTFFTQQRISTKMGIITYDENTKALMSDDYCLKARQLFGTNPPNPSNTSTMQSISYGGSLMSDPAYSNSAILTSNGQIITVYSQQGSVITPELTAILSKVASTFTLLNGNTVFVPECAK